MYIVNAPRSLRAVLRQNQRGVSLLESLVALIVLSLGILGLVGVQARMLVENRTTNHRAVAVGLIEDLSNRMLLNRAAALGNPAAATPEPSRYALAWTAAATAAQNCLTASCTGEQLAQSDLNLWRAAVARALPGGRAGVFQSTNDPRQIGIVVAWTASEGKGKDTDKATYTQPFKITIDDDDDACPKDLICHLVYVQP